MQFSKLNLELEVGRVCSQIGEIHQHHNILPNSRKWAMESLRILLQTFISLANLRLFLVLDLCYLVILHLSIHLFLGLPNFLLPYDLLSIFSFQFYCLILFTLYFNNYQTYRKATSKKN